MLVHKDCKYYLGSSPCAFHKQDERLCENCRDYSPIKYKILIIKLGALGDVLRTTSLLPALDKAYPQAKITWITRRNAKPLLEHNDQIDLLYAVEDNYLEFILTQKFDIGICLDADNLSASILKMSHADKKYGFITNDMGSIIPCDNNAEYYYQMGINDGLKKSNRNNYHEIIYETAHLPNDKIYKPTIILQKDQIQFAERFSKKYNLKHYQKIIGINTGAGQRWQLKKFTVDGYINLINSLRQNYPDMAIILFGGTGEKKFNQQIIAGIDYPLVDTGTGNTLEEFMALVSLTDIMITPDSLGMHISIALNKITFAFIGPTSPWEISVFDNGEVFYSEEIDCIACYLNTCSKQINCMNTLSVDRFIHTIKKNL